MKPVTGQRARIVTAPARLSFLQNQECRVVRVEKSPAGFEVATVEVSSGTRHDLMLSYLDGIRETKPRASSLTLKCPQDERTEAERQAEGKAWLQSFGYTVLEVGQARKGFTCPKCGEWHVPTGYVGNTPGTPDMFVLHRRWPGVPKPALPVEWKRAQDGERRPEQAELESMDLLVVVWDVTSLARALLQFEDGLGIRPLPGVGEWASDSRISSPISATTLVDNTDSSLLQSPASVAEPAGTKGSHHA